MGQLIADRYELKDVVGTGGMASVYCAYDTLLDRLNSARIELDTARAAFKYRYTIVRPPQLPKRPVKPKVPVVVGGGVLAATVLAVASTCSGSSPALE